MFIVLYCMCSVLSIVFAQGLCLSYMVQATVSVAEVRLWCTVGVCMHINVIHVWGSCAIVLCEYLWHLYVPVSP